jgi:Xaa-Pro aminopeptidase
MKSIPVDAALFIKNRQKLVEQMASGSTLVMESNEPVPRNGDQFYPFRQRSDFYYLTGINQEESVLVLSPAFPDSSFQEVLFIRKPTSKMAVWSGPGLSREEAVKLSGITQVKWLDELESVLDRLLPHASILYGIGKVYQEKISRHYGELEFSQLSPLMTRLRMIKEPEEVDEIRKAITITRSAFLRVLHRLKPGVFEYEMEAEIIAEFIGKGAEGHAYEPIIAAGKNALILHYVENNSRCLKGDLLLMDFGAEVNNYAADCSRTLPVNGRYSKRQREVYEAVLRVFHQARAMMVSGTLMEDFHNQVGRIWQEEHLTLGLYSRKEAASAPKENPLWKQYFMHGTSHALGLDVHDPFDRSQPFRPGMVLTCEPAIYIPEEGIGIRLENDILITDGPPVDLMEEIPIEPEEIEELMHLKK